MPTQTQFTSAATPTTHLVSTNPPAITSVHGYAAAKATVDSPITAPAMRFRFGWLSSLVKDTVAIPALYGFVTPVIAWYIPHPRQFLFAVLPACLVFALGLTRKKKRSGFLTGVVFGAIVSAASIVEAAFRGSYIPPLEIILVIITSFAFLGAVLGMVATGIRQGLVWLFAPNRP